MDAYQPSQAKSTPMDIDAYLKRIHYSLPVRPDRPTLEALINAHLQSVIFENLDQQLGIPVSNEIEQVYEKVIERNRGGWCFELNGLFAWLLNEIGFEVSILAGWVGQDKPSRIEPADHMLLLVICDEPLIVDVGFGGGQRAPLPLSCTQVSQPPYTLSLRKTQNESYHFVEKAGGNDSGYCFTLEPKDQIYFDAISRALQTEPNSPFKRTLTAQRRFTDRHLVLRGRVKKTIDDQGVHEKVLSSSKALVACLEQDFNLSVPEISNCWPRLLRRHEELFGEEDS